MSKNRENNPKNNEKPGINGQIYRKNVKNFEQLAKTAKISRKRQKCKNRYKTV